MATDDTNSRDGEVTRFDAGRVTAGAILLGLGVLLLLDRTRPLAGHATQLIPGFVLIVIGAMQMAGGRDCARRGPFRGFWPILVGAWLIVNATHLWGLTYETSWPLLIVALGVLMVLREIFPGARRAAPGRKS
jgi:hypothetical protein